MYEMKDMPKTMSEFVAQIRNATTTMINFIPLEQNREAFSKISNFQLSMAEVYADQFDRTMSMFTGKKTEATKTKA